MTPPACPHLRTRRFGRSTGDGRLVVERRCGECGRTVNVREVGQ